MSAATSGISFALGGLLFVAGILKLRDPNPFGWALLRLFPIGWTGWKIIRPLRLAVLVGVTEVGVGAGVMVAPGLAGTAMALGTAILFIAFAGVVNIAIRHGVGCGCWSSLSDGPATGAEMGRSLFFAVSAAALAATRLVTGDSTAWSLGAVCAAGGLLFSGWIVTRLGEKLRPGRSKATVRGPMGSSSRIVREGALLLGAIGHRSGHRHPPAIPAPAD